MTAGGRTTGYVQWAPPPGLAEAVDAFWRYTGPPHGSGAGPTQSRILPDGCTDLIFQFRASDGPTWLAAPRLAIVGPMERFALVDIHAGAVSFGVRLKPGWALPLLGVSPRELCGLNVPVADCAPAFTRLQRRLEDCPSPARALALLQETFTQRMASPLATPRPRVTEALHQLQSSGGQVRMAGLARSLGVSERTLHRDVLDEAGVPPKLLARVLRFQRAVSLLRSGTEEDLASVALACGYADQAHLSREVKELSGVTPSALVK
ncbi:AraC family transcriptional regulator [Pyxidicoccus fallax]|uniref:AraC family transcriptional regulator n=1 Tax=Pyxidicoccus fallax TaxID=394095 RepID=A0A848LIZ1_9BACT|nr:helix-turn-helix domain-containing protein [Pyxidicoccus fallax]NMO17646.1 AraC family transcriptional regulator [Pyxidicoccus fallax]NPC79564.1 AraC family transcriptional regulator [Pyxidicoccus fallax]